MRTVYTSDTNLPPAEFKVKLCGGNHVKQWEQVSIVSGSVHLGNRWIKEIHEGYYVVTNKLPETPSYKQTQEREIRARRELRDKRNMDIARWYYEDGRSAKDIAKAFGLSPARIYSILRRYR